MGRDWVRVFSGMGANAGEPSSQLQLALAALQELPLSKGLRCSRFYRSAPWQAEGPDFINAVAQLDTQFCAPEFLKQLQKIEQSAGRTRPYHHAPRTLDLDLIFFGQACIDSGPLVVPHPRWRERAFVLHPLADLAPERIHASDWHSVASQVIQAL